MSLAFEREADQCGDNIKIRVEASMKNEKTGRYEKPTLTSYRFFGVVKGDDDEWEDGISGGGDISEVCDSGFDD